MMNPRLSYYAAASPERKRKEEETEKKKRKQKTVVGCAYSNSGFTNHFVAVS
jgi:hypothetical protein